MDLERYMYQDPAAILEQQERRTCKGCIYRAKLWGAEYCTEGKSKPGSANMRRCKSYKTEEEK